MNAKISISQVADDMECQSKKKSVSLEQTARILVVLNDAGLRSNLVGIIDGANRQVVASSYGNAAINAFQLFDPDLVIIDVGRRDAETFTILQRLKELSGGHYLPVIGLAGSSDEELLSAFIEAGGDDVVVKPVSTVLLQSKVTAFLRTRELYNRQFEHREQLLTYREMMEREFEVAKKIFASFICAESLDQPNINYHLSPKAVFHGDMLLATKTPAGNEHILLGDFTGQGLSASIGSLPASEIFYAMSAKDYSLGEILVEINTRLRDLLPMNMFLAVGAIEISHNDGQVSVWNAGLPNIIIRAKANDGLLQCPSEHLPLGIKASSEIDLQPQRYSLSEGDSLFIFTDGAVKAENIAKEYYGMNRIVSVLHERANASTSFDRLCASIHEFQANADLVDDITILSYQYQGGLSCLESSPDA